MTEPAWTRCHFCPEWWCVIHNLHAFECPCPPIEEWEVDPYSEQPPEASEEEDAEHQAFSANTAR